jgi:hypothetical protein
MRIYANAGLDLVRRNSRRTLDPDAESAHRDFGFGFAAVRPLTSFARAPMVRAPEHERPFRLD